MLGSRAGGSRDLRTVLFTDIVGSTERAAQLGDHAWGDLLARHHALVRAGLRATGGHEVDTAGDGFFATFARPTAALACSIRIATAMAGLELAVRVGIHAGEVETREGKAGGITVHTAARLMAAAGADEVLVSATVRDLVAGAGWTFTDRGPIALKGLPEPVHAYALELASAPAGPAGRVGITPALRLSLPVGLGAIAIAVAAVLVAGNIVGGAGRPTPTRTSVALIQSTSPPTEVVSPVASPATSESTITIPGLTIPGAFPLGPGRYVDPLLPGSPTLTVVDPGWVVAKSIPVDLLLSRATSPTDQVGVHWLRVLATDPCALQPQATLGLNPEAQFVAWAASMPGLEISTGIPRTFGSLSTTEFDVTVVGRKACQGTDPRSVAVTAFDPGESDGLVLQLGARLRLEVSSHNDQLIVVVISAPSAAEFDSFDPLVEKLLNTLTFAA